ncbi:hypothetical protein B2J88_47125 [Rhodococcus sp. SRB_17]|nr:hypothetical protein [Rhodococcus sp. SRB_17]
MNESSRRSEAEAIFRLDNEILAFRFTATLSDRGGAQFERLTDPSRLDLWLHANCLDLGSEPASTGELREALQLREAIHRVGTAVADQRSGETRDIDLLNRESACGKVHLALEGEAAVWKSSGPSAIEDALAVIAANAIEVFGGDRRGRVKACQWKSCGGLYLDTSRGDNRRWCSMNICGNRAKKAAMNTPDL